MIALSKVHNTVVKKHLEHIIGYHVGTETADADARVNAPEMLPLVGTLSNSGPALDLSLVPTIEEYLVNREDLRSSNGV